MSRVRVRAMEGLPEVVIVGLVAVGIDHRGGGEGLVRCAGEVEHVV